MSSDANRTFLKEKGIVLPTFRQLSHPQDSVPEDVIERLAKTDMQAFDPVNLYRLTWYNDTTRRGVFRDTPNYLELPASLTGCCKVVVMLGERFPTHCHKVGATYWPLVESLLDGNFDPRRHSALWPSTGNYCRGGAFDSRLLGCKCIAVLPEGMSRERFQWLERAGAEVHRTPGTESDVRHVFDKAAELGASEDVVVFNQFSHFGNPLFHYAVTGPAMDHAARLSNGGSPPVGFFACQGSAGILAAAEYLRERHPHLIVGAGEALQCSTLLTNGHGSHRIEGIGDKHVPWILNARNLDVVAAIDDEVVMSTARLFNDPHGRQFLDADKAVLDSLSLLGLSGIANVIGAIKMARNFDMKETDVIVTVATDSMAMYKQTLAKFGPLTLIEAAKAHQAFRSITTDHMEELTYSSRKRIHNLKYFTWVEQRGMTAEELDEQWDDPDYYHSRYRDKVARSDEMIAGFNK